MNTRFITLLLTVWSISISAHAYKLVWSDEFDYDGLPDSSKWTYEEGYVRNKEIQYYTFKNIKNAKVANGKLHLITRQEPETGKVTSASIKTENIASWTYGKIEVRARIPRQKGMWPAIWMLGANLREVYWPRSGEIDIMEHVSKHPGRIHGNAIYFDHETQGRSKNRAPYKEIKSPYAMHTYSIEWTKNKIDYFVDGELYHTFDTSVATAHGENPFHKPQFLIINLAVGGAWPGPPDENSFPAQFVIDYVRVYQKEECN